MATAKGKSRAPVKKAAPKKNDKLGPKDKAVKLDAIETHISTLVEDWEQARKHGPQSIGAISQSLREVGFRRSIGIGRKRRVLGGNGVLEAAAAEGFEKVIILPVDGKTIVALESTDLDDHGERRFALWDNRTGELSAWDGKVIAQFAQIDPGVLEGMFNAGDLTRMFAEASAEFRAQGIEGGPEGEASAPQVPDSHVRMQQLFLDTNTFPEFHTLVETLMKKWATTTPTDTVMEALRRCARSA